MKYKQIERAQELALNDVDVLQYLTKRQLHELKNITRNADSLLVSSIIRNACIQINASIEETLENARKLLK
jgi:hypothetical protein